MPVRKRRDGRFFAEFDPDELEQLGESRLLYAGDPSDSDPGYEVPQILKECFELFHSFQSKMFGLILPVEQVIR